ncbi:MAG: hypothetical protein U0234_25895 [Sandaracinus sp.]
MARFLASLAALGLASWMMGCSTPAVPPTDTGGGVDTGAADTGTRDTGVQVDAGTDAASPDTGARDVGTDADRDVGTDAATPIPCSVDAPCDIGYVCQTPDGMCDGAGFCEPYDPRTLCPGFDPVCGCNGLSYENRCIAQRSGNTVDHVGVCDGTTLCQTDADCEPGAFCEKPDGVCGEGDGICVRPPIGVFCTQICAPQCGCDGVTYLNSCFRLRARTTPTGEAICAGGVPPCAVAGACCTGNLDCDVGQQCVPDTTDGATSVCEPIFGVPACWNDSECDPGQTCQGISVCPCGTTCPDVDAPGTCA